MSTEMLSAITAVVVTLLTTINGIGIALANNWRKKEAVDRAVVAAKVEVATKVQTVGLNNVTAAVADTHEKAEALIEQGKAMMEQGKAIHLAVNTNYQAMQVQLTEAQLKQEATTEKVAAQAKLIGELLAKLGNSTKSPLNGPTPQTE